jgi:hypothetical protein
MEGAEDFKTDLQRMHEQASATEQRTDALVDGLEGKKTAIRDKARDTKGEATEMMQTYLGGEDEALDGFEFLYCPAAHGVSLNTDFLTPSAGRSACRARSLLAT